MKKVERRSFIKKAAIGVAGASTLISACGKDESNQSAAVHSNKKYNWKMVTAWPPHFPILGEFADKLAKEIEIMSQGRLKIHVYGGGELVPPFESFDAVSQGVAEMGHCASYYWAGKAPAAQFFTSIPFGMNTQQTNAWLLKGGGLELWSELYSTFDLIPFPAGNTGGQMGGWFNKKIDEVNDLKGLKMRMPGIGGNVITKSGSSAILSPGGEIFTNLERGVIDATDWVGPYHDYLMGFHKIAKYYYSPGWAEPTGVVELIVNKSAYEKLPIDLQEIIKHVSLAANVSMTSEFEYQNIKYLEKIQNESDVEFKKFPESVLNELKKKTSEVIEELISEDQMSKKVFESYSKFQNEIKSWNDLSKLWPQ